MTLYTTNGNDAEWPFVYHAFTEAGIQEKFNSLKNFADMTAKVNKPEYAQQGIEELKNAGIKFKVYGAAPFIVTQLEGIKASRATMKDDASAKAADDAIKAVNDAK